MQTFGRSITVFALLALTGTVGGCAIRFPRLSLDEGHSPTEAARPSQSEAPAGPSMPYRTATGSLPTYTGSGPATGTASPPPSENSISATFKKATRSVADALTIKPKVIKAQDPTSLASDPGPIGPDLYVSAARMAESQGDFAGAQAQYEHSLTLQADCLPALIGLSRLHHRQGRIDLAIQYGRQAVAAHPQSAVAHNDLGLCYARQRQFDAAIQSLSQAVYLQPRSKLYRNNLAASLVFAGRLNEAQMHLSQAHGDAVAHYNLGYLLYQQGRADESVAYFQRALQLDPQLTSAAQMLMRLRAQSSAASTVARPAPGRQFHQVGIEPPPQDVRRPDPPSIPPPAQEDGDAPARRLPPVTDPLPRLRNLLSIPPANEPPADTPAPNLNSAWPAPAPTHNPPPTAGNGPSRDSEFELPPIVSPDSFSRPSPGPSSRRVYDATTDRNSGFPTDPSLPGFELPSAPPPSVPSSGPQTSNALDFGPSEPTDPGAGESLPAPSTDGGPRMDPSTAGLDPGVASEDVTTRRPPVTEPSSTLRLSLPSLGPVGNGTRRLAPPPPTPEETPAPIVSPPRRDQAYELWPADSR